MTYSNKAKRKFLGVRKSTLDKYGAVSSKTASEMAKGAALLMKSDVAVAVTGIAGPDGGTEFHRVPWVGWLGGVNLALRLD